METNSVVEHVFSSVKSLYSIFSTPKNVCWAWQRVPIFPMFKRLRQKNEFKDSLDTIEWAWSQSVPMREFASKKGGGENKIKYLGGNMSELFIVPV